MQFDFKKILYIHEKYLLAKKRVVMTEVELNALFNISPEKVKNVYATNTIKSQEEIRRIVKIFNIAQDQRKTSKKISARGLAAFRAILVSNN